MIIDALAADHEIVLISLVDETLEAPGVLPRVPGATAQYRLPLPAFKPLSPSGIAGALSRIPRSTVATWSRQTAERINDIVRNHNATVAVGTDIRTFRYLTYLPGNVARILDEPDVSPFVTAMAGSNGGVLNGFRARLREEKYRHLVRDPHNQLDLVTVASKLEADAFQRLSGGPSTTIDNGVPALPDLRWSPAGDSTLLYTGALTYPPNLDAVEFLAADVLPTLQRSRPDLRLIVTGAIPDPPPALAAHPQISLTGRLPSLDGLYQDSRLFIMPLRSGTGTRIKLLEAMSFGMPIISTRKGAEGLPVVHGEHLLLADTAGEMIDSVLRLLDDRDLCERLGTRARALVARNYTAGAIASLWRTAITEAIAHQQARNSHV